jgi:hypothetical protein
MLMVVCPTDVIFSLRWTLLSVVSDNPRDLQILVNQAVQYSITHRYKLQPQKSVVIEVNKKGRNQQDKNLPLDVDYQ